MLGAYVFKGYIFLVDFSLKLFEVSFVSFYGLCFEIYVVWYKWSIATDISSFFQVHLLRLLFSSTLLSVCVGLFFWGGSLVNIYVGNVLLSIQLPYVFWLEHLMHFHLGLLTGTYSLPFFPFVPVFLFLSLFLHLLKAVPLAYLAMLVWWRCIFLALFCFVLLCFVWETPYFTFHFKWESCWVE